uniref:Uncharacterized protein n=1 Tax=Caenorhabditis japonica TaxID=281687 RepID=A0A8R1DKK7_CAEJA
MIRTRQSQLRKIRFSNVELSDRHALEIQNLFEIALRQCENIIVENSMLPISFDPVTLNSAKFDHFSWVSSTGSSTVPTDAILQKLQYDMKSAVNKRSFLAEMDSISVEVMCDFLEVCSHVTSNRYQFLCTYFLLFLTTFTLEDASTCCIWPVLDVPARTTGQSVCYARYFRNF